MKITLEDLEKFDSECDEYYLNAPTYIDGLVIVQSGADSKDADALSRKLKRMCDKYEGMSYLLIISTTDSKTAKRETIHNKQRGRPKTVVRGKKVDGHLHGQIVNTNPDTKIKAIKGEVQTFCNKRRAKKPKLKQQKISALTGMFIGKYMYKQADEVHRGGEFDFDYFLNDKFRSF